MKKGIRLSEDKETDQIRSLLITYLPAGRAGGKNGYLDFQRPDGID